MSSQVPEQESSSSLTSASIFERFRDPIYHYIFHLVPHAMEAEDLTQETFLRAHQHLNDLQSPEALRSWLFRIATHICYDRFRQASFRIEPVSLDAVDNSTTPQEEDLPEGLDEPSLELVIDQVEMSGCIQSYISRLADNYRITILLHDIHGMTCAEISQILSCSLELTKIRLFRARKKLKTILAAECTISTASQGNLTCDPKYPSH